MVPPSEKYDADDHDFDAEHGVLRNKLDIVDARELERAENQALIRAYDSAALSYTDTHTFTSNDVRSLHHLFLNDLFDWAGEHRLIDLSSPGIRWCHARFIDVEMAKFNDRLAEITPFSPDMSREEILTRSAEIHGELIIIHPFRDGNGRTGRLLGDLLLMQAETPPMKLTELDDAEIREEYFAAIRSVWTQTDYTRLIRIFDLLMPKP